MSCSSKLWRAYKENVWKSKCDQCIIYITKYMLITKQLKPIIDFLFHWSNKF